MAASLCQRRQNSRRRSFLYSAWPDSAGWPSLHFSTLTLLPQAARPRVAPAKGEAGASLCSCHFGSSSNRIPFWLPQTAKPRLCKCNPRVRCSPRVAPANSHCSRSVRQAGPAGPFAEAAEHWRRTAPEAIMVALRKRAPCGSLGGNAGLRCRRSEIRWEDQ